MGLIPGTFAGDLGELGMTTRPAARPGGIVRTATHVHTSFSEGEGGRVTVGGHSTAGSMEGQAAAHAALGVDLLFFTDHDHRFNAEGWGMRPPPFPAVEEFAKPNWTYVVQRAGATRSGDVVQTAAGRVASVTSGAGDGWVYAWADTGSKGWNHRAILAGQTLALTLAAPTGPGWAELRLQLSYRPATAGRPAGNYEIAYRFRPSANSRTVTSAGTVATVTIPAPAAVSREFTLDPVADLRQAFPALGAMARDNCLYALWIGAGAPAGSSARATFTRLKFTRSVRGSEALALQAEMLRDLAPRYRSLRMVQGLEMSYAEHLNWLGATAPTSILRPAGYRGRTEYTKALVAAARAADACVTLNHPFGASYTKLITGVERQRMIAACAQRVLSVGAYGVDAVEVGYPSRAGMDLAGHLEMWDIVLAAGVRVGGVGCSDNHSGAQASYRQSPNRMVTDIIADTSDPETSVPALRAGRAFVSLLEGYGGMLDLATADAVMGGVAKVTSGPVDLTARATDLPTGGSLRLVQYTVHGNRGTTAIRSPLVDRSVPASALPASGEWGVRLEPAASYVRTEVRDRRGQVVAFSNPLYLSPRA